MNLILSRVDCALEIILRSTPTATWIRVIGVLSSASRAAFCFSNALRAARTERYAGEFSTSEPDQYHEVCLGANA
jgi:hypothetical protein